MWGLSHPRPCSLTRETAARRQVWAFAETLLERASTGCILQSSVDRIDLITQQIKDQEGVTEALKAADQMAWIAHMNSIQNRAEEIVLCELVFA